MGLADWLFGIGAPEAPALESKALTMQPGMPGYETFLAARQQPLGRGVGPLDALQCGAFLCGVRVIAEALAQVPCKIIQEDEAGRRTVARQHEAFWALYRQPNQHQTAFEFREQIGIHLVTTGNAFIVKTRDTRGRLLELLPYEPGCVTVKRNDDLSISYWVHLVNGQQIAVPEADMWHIRGASWNGYLGLPGVQLARQALGLSLAAEEYAADMFANGARPSGILRPKDRQLSPDEMKSIAASFAETHAGTGNRFKTLMLNGVVEWQGMSGTADDAQMVELRNQQVVEVARFLRINPIMLMHQEGFGAYASVEQLHLSHLTHTLKPWFERFEQSAERALLTNAEIRAGYRVELIDAELALATAKERAETLAIERQNGIISPNEWRDQRDYPRMAGEGMDEARPAQNLYGGDEPPPPPPPPQEKAEPVAVTLNIAPQPVTVNTPPVNFKADAPVVHVAPAEVHVAAPAVTVESPRIDVQMSKGGRQVKTIEYDGEGNVSRIVEDDA